MSAFTLNTSLIFTQCRHTKLCYRDVKAFFYSGVCHCGLAAYTRTTVFLSACSFFCALTGLQHLFDIQTTV